METDSSSSGGSTSPVRQLATATLNTHIINANADGEQEQKAVHKSVVVERSVSQLDL